MNTPPTHPKLNTPIPGPESRRLISTLARFECPAITARQWTRAQSGGIEVPIVWKKTHGVWVEDVDDNRFLDLTAGFGVCAAGHAHPTIVAAAQHQLAEMPHTMGDAFPAHIKVHLAERLAHIAPKGLTRCLFANSGCEAIEAALKTALLRTGKPGVIAFEHAYHGLGYGALSVTAYRESFRAPFLAQLNPHVYRLPYPSNPNTLKQQLSQLQQSAPIGALIIEPILGRGGIIEAPGDCLRLLREFTSAHGVVWIADEICTGLGRTGDWFALEASGVTPDLLCLGKALSGGFPISVVMGTDDAMSGWRDTQGEAIHTSTFLGNPVGCAMALANLDLLESGLVDKVKPIGAYFKARLETLKAEHSCIRAILGRGLMLGIAFEHPDPNWALKISHALLRAGIICLPCGTNGDTLSITPPYIIETAHIDYCIEQLSYILGSSNEIEI